MYIATALLYEMRSSESVTKMMIRINFLNKIVVWVLSMISFDR